MVERPSRLDVQEQAAFAARQAKPYALDELTDEQRRAYWEGLPEELRTEILAKRVAERRDEDIQMRLLWRHRWKYAAGGGAVAGIVGVPMGSSSALFPILMMIVGAAAALLIAAHRIDHITGCLIYGGGTIATAVIGAATGMLHLNVFVGFWCWLFLAAGGTGLSMAAEMEYERRHSVY